MTRRWCAKHCSRDLRVVRPVLLEIEDIVGDIEKIRREFDNASARLYRRRHPGPLIGILSTAAGSIYADRKGKSWAPSEFQRARARVIRATLH
jgi:hypothetical protein